VIDAIRQLLEQSPLLAVFAAIGLGYALGRISIGGFSLDIGAVLFAGLALGAMAPKSAPPGLVSSIGLVMFLYGIGIQYGRQFFAGLRGSGLKWNLLAGVGVLGALVATLGLGAALGISPAHAMGLFAGSLTSTPTLQAAIDAAGNRDPAIGYSVAYPFGVVGPILCLFVLSRVLALRLAPAPAPLETLEIILGADRQGLRVSDLIAQLPAGAQLVAIRQGQTNKLPAPELRLNAGDVILLYGQPALLELARQQLGRAERGRVTADRGALDIARFFVSRAALTGVPLGQLPWPAGVEARIVEVRRGDAVLLPYASLVLESGDRVAVIASRDALRDLRRHFGDSIKSTTEFSYISVGLGMSLGVLLGLVPFPIPGIGMFSLGLAGGPLIAALVLGRFGRTGPLSWHMPLPANLTLRTFGLTLFLAAVGLSSGGPFVETVASAGLPFLATGAAIVLTAVLVAALAGQYLMKMATDDLFGVVSGLTGNPAILVYANRVVTSERIDAAFAIIFPSMTILKILCAQVALGVLR
jgi:putative transport protein